MSYRSCVLVFTACSTAACGSPNCPEGATWSEANGRCECPEGLRFRDGYRGCWDGDAGPVIDAARDGGIFDADLAFDGALSLDGEVAFGRDETSSDADVSIDAEFESDGEEIDEGVDASTSEP